MALEKGTGAGLQYNNKIFNGYIKIGVDKNMICYDTCEVICSTFIYIYIYIYIYNIIYLFMIWILISYDQFIICNKFWVWDFQFHKE